MTWSIGLLVGESLLELTAKPTNAKDAPVLKLRTFASNAALESTITQFLSQNDIQQIGEINGATLLPQRIIETEWGSPIALLTTIGFENWLELSRPKRQKYFRLNPTAQRPLVDRSLVFGVNERVNAHGHIEKLVVDADLEFLASKLELNKVKQVSIAFLNSTKNPENENRVAQFLRQKNFQVFTSTEAPGAAQDDVARFWWPTLNAYISAPYLERLRTVFQGFQKNLIAGAVATIGEVLWSDLLEQKTPPLPTSFALTNHLSEKFARTSPLLYCGLEEFIHIPAGADLTANWASPVGPVQAPHRKHKKLSLQPLSKLGPGVFSDFSWTADRIGYDPGPMIFGRGLIPTFLDVLHIKFDLSSLPGLGEKISDRGVSRLKENLQAYSRSLTQRDHLSPQFQLANWLLDSGAARWKAELGLDFGRNLLLCGPLAPATQKLLGGQVFGDDFFVSTSLLMGRPTT